MPTTRRLIALYRVLDSLVDSMFPFLATLDDRIDDLQDELFDSPRPEQLSALFGLKRQLVDMRKLVTAQRDMVASRLTGVVPIAGMTPDTERYVRDLYDHLIRISDMVDSSRDLLKLRLAGGPHRFDGRLLRHRHRHRGPGRHRPVYPVQETRLDVRPAELARDRGPCFVGRTDRGPPSPDTGSPSRRPVSGPPGAGGGRSVNLSCGKFGDSRREGRVVTEWSQVLAVARPLPEPEPQPVVSPLTDAAIFMVLTIQPGGEAAVRDLLSDWAALQRAVGVRAPKPPMACVAGTGSKAWDRLFSGPRPAELHPFRELTGTVQHAPATPGDLTFHVRHERMDLCFEFATQAMIRLAGAAAVVDEVHGFRYFDERDLLGFVDGTENPVGAAAGTAALVGDSDPDFVGGSYLIVQKYLHDMAAWNALTTEDQEKAIGRSKLSDIEMPDDIKPANSHVALNTIENPDGTERQILRANMPFGELGRGEFGTYYAGYAATRA